MQALKRTYLIDIGNSALKWAEATTPQNTGVITYGDMVMLAEQVRDFYRHQRPELIYACTVAHSVIASTVQQVCERTRIELLGSQREFNGSFHVVNHYDDYTKLGPDRWYAALGAVSKHPDENLLIVQMGTALTADSIICRGEGEYEYLGGRIAPGPTMMFKSLQQGTARLHVPSGTYQTFPQNSSDGISTGITDCVRGFISGGLEAMGNEAKPKLVITGGAAHYYEKAFRQYFPDYLIEDNLVITGLSLRIRSENEE